MLISLGYLSWLLRFFEVSMPNSELLYSWLFIPFLIFAARICDVTIGTMRVIFLAKGYKRLAPFLGFFEVIIWLVAIRQVMMHLENAACFLAYGLGFATGNYVGMMLEEKLSLGLVILRIVFRKNSDDFINFMRKSNMGYTLIDGEGNSEKVKIFLSVLKRSNLKEVLPALRNYNPGAFYTIEDVKNASEGIFRGAEAPFIKNIFRKMRIKGK